MPIHNGADGAVRQGKCEEQKLSSPHFSGREKEFWKRQVSVIRKEISYPGTGGEITRHVPKRTGTGWRRGKTRGRGRVLTCLGRTWREKAWVTLFRGLKQEEDRSVA